MRSCRDLRGRARGGRRRITSTSPPSCGPNSKRSTGSSRSERFESADEPGKILSAAFWRDDARRALAAPSADHEAQLARARPHLSRLSVARRRGRAPVYGIDSRDEAPQQMPPRGG